MTKKITFAILLVLCAGLILNACSLDGLSKGNTTLAKEIRNMGRQGFELRMDSSNTWYTQLRYLVDPSGTNHQDGFGQVEMVLPASGMSLTTVYATITFDGWESARGKCSTRNLSTTTQTIY